MNLLVFDLDFKLRKEKLIEKKKKFHVVLNVNMFVKYRKYSFNLNGKNVQFWMGMLELIFHEKLSEKGVGFYLKKTKKILKK